MTNHHIDFLQRTYPDKLVFELSLVAKIISLDPQTARNQIWKGTFPIKTFLRGKKRYVGIRELASYLDSLNLAASEKPGRGRPRKADQIARREAALGGAK